MQSNLNSSFYNINDCRVAVRDTDSAVQEPSGSEQRAQSGMAMAALVHCANQLACGPAQLILAGRSAVSLEL